MHFLTNNINDETARDPRIMESDALYLSFTIIAIKVQECAPSLQGDLFEIGMTFFEIQKGGRNTV
jgi:hypothetical protein